MPLQLHQYFTNPADLEQINTLLQAAHLVHGTGAGITSSSDGGTEAGSSPECVDEAWVAVYASDIAETCLQVLAFWMPDFLADGFLRHHKVSFRQHLQSIQSTAALSRQQLQ